MCCADRKKYDRHQQKQAWSVAERPKARSSLHRKIRWNCEYDSEYDENNGLPVFQKPFCFTKITTHFLRGELQRISINSHNIVSFKEIRTRIPATAIGRTRRRCSRSACPPRHSDLKLIRLQFIPIHFRDLRANGLA